MPSADATVILPARVDPAIPPRRPCVERERTLTGIGFQRAVVPQKRSEIRQGTVRRSRLEGYRKAAGKAEKRGRDR